MKDRLITKLLLAVFIGLFSQVTLAQGDANDALKQIADIVAGLNHFPSDADKATLGTISANEAYPVPLRNMANAVSNINHSATAEGKQVMADIQAMDAAPPAAKELAGIIASLNHTPSAEAKARLAELFP